MKHTRAIGSGVAVVLALGGCGGSSAPSGYHNMSKLAHAIQASVKNGTIGFATSVNVNCLPTGSNTAECQLDAALMSGTTYSDSDAVDIAPNGSNFIIAGHSN